MGESAPSVRKHRQIAHEIVPDESAPFPLPGQIAGGVGLLASTLEPVSDVLPGLRSASALGLLALAIAVTPANIFMATHNAPGPGPAGQVTPPAGHAFRAVMQVLLWSALWALANPVP